MMYDYIVGLLFYVVFILFLYIVGLSVLENKSEPYCFFVGYIIYSVLIGVGGIVIQQFNVSWNIFLFYLIFIVFVLLIFSIYQIKKKKINIFLKSFKEFFKNYWFLFIISIVLVIISLSYQDWLWLNNCLDDGQYLNKMATLPYIDNPFITSPPTGIVGPSNGLRLDVFTTGELENSVYMYLTQVTPSVFARVFMAGFNYFLLVNCIYIFSEKIINSCNIEYKKYSIQYISCIVILFIFNWDFLAIHNIMQVQDSWQFNTAMYYGSSIVRTTGILFLITHFIDKEKIVLKDVIIVVLISFVLMTHSSIALPVIFTTCVAYLLSNHILKLNKYSLISVIVAIILIIVGAYLGDSSKISNVIVFQFSENISSWLILCALFVLVIANFIKSKIIAKCNLIVLFIAGLILIEPLNNIFEKLSVYDFVAARNLTTLIYTILILMSIYLFIFFSKVSIIRKKINLYYFFISLILIISSLYTSHIYSGNIFDAYRVIWNNKAIMPNSTIELGKKLSQLANNENKSLNVLMPEGALVNGDSHALAIIIRTFAPEIRSISAISRFGTWETGEFSEYDSSDQKIFDEFLIDSNKNTANNLKEMLDKYPINCIVIPTVNDNKYIEMMGYESYDKFLDNDAGIGYNIYYKNK